MALRQLVTAFDNFFSKRAKYPRYKSRKHSKQSFAIPQNIKLSKNRVILPKFKEGIKAKIHKILSNDCVIKQAFISCVAGNYYVSLSYEDNKSIPKPVEIKSAVGLDMGLENLLIRSDKIVYENKKFLQNKEAKLIKLQKAVSKKKKGSNNRAKAIKKLAIAHHRVVLARDDYLHKITNEITNDYDFIAIENLNVKGLIRNKHLSKA